MGKDCNKKIKGWVVKDGKRVPVYAGCDKKDVDKKKK